ncbi:MAG: alcohol dehydrogenase catalytic domain-containing protein [bacterium]
MKAWVLRKQAAVDATPLALEEIETPKPRDGEAFIKVLACGVCLTDLHIIEGDLPLHKAPVIPGHQIVGAIYPLPVRQDLRVGNPGSLEGLGTTPELSPPPQGGRKDLRSASPEPQTRNSLVGVPWLSATCPPDNLCKFCAQGQENLCERATFTGYDRDGGYAEFAAAPADSVYPIPAGLDPIEAAPLLCSGVIGYRALRLATELHQRRGPGPRPTDRRASGEFRVGLYGFGSSAHLVLRIARHFGYEMFVFSRSEAHRKLARTLGAAWAGPADDTPPAKLDVAILFAPVGALVPVALAHLDRGGTLALAGIHMSPTPPIEYSLLYHERTIRSVANSSRQDIRDTLRLAAEIPLKPEVEVFDYKDAPKALTTLKRGAIAGSAVLKMPG